MFYWEQSSEFKCGADWCVGRVCRHRAVLNDEELDKKISTLRLLLQIEDENDWHDNFYIEELVKSNSAMRFDPNVTNKSGNVNHIDYNWTKSPSSHERGSFFHTVRTECALRKWNIRGNPKHLVLKLK